MSTGKKKPETPAIIPPEPDDPLERAANAALVHDWFVFQCDIDPELRRIYEQYIGPVPSISYDTYWFKGKR